MDQIRPNGPMETKWVDRSGLFGPKRPMQTEMDHLNRMDQNRPKCYVDVAQQKSNSSAKFHFELYIYTSIFSCDAWLNEDSYVS